MKLNAIANRGAKKDFYDIDAMLAEFTMLELLEFFQKKYQKNNYFTVTKSLLYFDDADLEPAPISLVNKTWEDIKKSITFELRKAV